MRALTAPLLALLLWLGACAPAPAIDIHVRPDPEALELMRRLLDDRERQAHSEAVLRGGAVAALALASAAALALALKRK